MKLMTKEIESTIPELGSQEYVTDPIVHVKYFTPDSNWTWYAIEYSQKERQFFGFVDGMFAEFGYFGLAELEEARGPFGLPIERDMYWEPRRLSEIVGDTAFGGDRGR
jgi:hypothetical protein